MSSSFGNRFKELRSEKGLKQQELVNNFNEKYHYNFTRAAISQYENDRRIPEVDALKNFAEYFNVSVDYLLGNSDIKKPIPNTLFSGSGALTNVLNNSFNSSKANKTLSKAIDIVNAFEKAGINVDDIDIDLLKKILETYSIFNNSK